jgi:signal transduction histidine kinase
MISAIKTGTQSASSFRFKLLLAMMLIVSAFTVLTFYFTQEHVAAAAKRDLQQNFQAELSALDKIRDLRQTALAERCTTLASRPRIHAALEDNALDLLYPSANDELRDLMQPEEPSSQQDGRSLRAKFYRFLDSSGAVLPPPNAEEVGKLDSGAETQLAHKKLPETQQMGYIRESDSHGNDPVDEVIAVPIFSTATGEVISALVVGFKPFQVTQNPAGAGVRSGIWVNNELYLPALSPTARTALEKDINNALKTPSRQQNNFRVVVDGAPQLLFFKRLNPGSSFPPAYEIGVYPLAPPIAQLHRLRWQIASAGALLMLAGFVASHFVAGRLAVPVEKLALDSEENRARRRRAEAALATKAEELQRSTRYSADASHQLKSPMAVLRTGLESLLARNDFQPEVYEELSAMLHQTHRLAGVIDDLLLLSQMDAGHLRLASEPVNLSELVEESIDDVSALPDSPEVKIEKDFPAGLHITGEKRYTSLIVQNVLENARRYNRSGGRMRVSADENSADVVLTVGNTGPTIRPEAQKHIFDRFHRGSPRSTVSGHGLGLNLARQLARLHGGDLRLVRSENDWTEFEVRFRLADHANMAA